MAVSVAPLTTTVMNSVTPNRVGIASGVNNAVARGAGLLAIAVLGIVMLHSFNHAIDRRLVDENASPVVWQSLQSQRNKLAGASLPEELDQMTRQLIGQAIGESFVHAFRLIMAIGATLAVVSAIVAWLLIGSAAQKEHSRAPKAFAD
jgi:Flp pilus assembly protein TadB